MLSQIIFTTSSRDKVTIEELVSIGVDNISICKSLGFTGQLFAIENEHLSVLEGAADLIENYFQAFSGDERVGSTLRHFSRLIESREFPDYSLWAKHSELNKIRPPELNPLTLESLDAALVPSLSVKVSLMIDGYIRANL